MPLLRSPRDHVWSYSTKDTTMTAQQQLVPRDGLGSVAGRVVFQGLRNV